MMEPTLVKSTWSSSYIYAFVVGLVLGYLPGTSWWNVPICGLALIAYDALFKTWRYRMNRKEYGYTLPKILLVGTLFYSIFAALLHDSTPARVLLLSQPLPHDTTA